MWMFLKYLSLYVCAVRLRHQRSKQEHKQIHNMERVSTLSPAVIATEFMHDDSQLTLPLVQDLSMSDVSDVDVDSVELELEKEDHALRSWS